MHSSRSDCLYCRLQMLLMLLYSSMCMIYLISPDWSDLSFLLPFLPSRVCAATQYCWQMTDGSPLTALRLAPLELHAAQLV